MHLLQRKDETEKKWRNSERGADVSQPSGFSVRFNGRLLDGGGGDWGGRRRKGDEHLPVSDIAPWFECSCTLFPLWIDLGTDFSLNLSQSTTGRSRSLVLLWLPHRALVLSTHKSTQDWTAAYCLVLKSFNKKTKNKTFFNQSSFSLSQNQVLYIFNWTKVKSLNWWVTIYQFNG